MARGRGEEADQRGARGSQTYRGKAMNVVGVDVGATKIATGVVSSEGKVLGGVRRAAGRGWEKVRAGVVRAVAEVRDGVEGGGVCVAVPGLLLSQESIVVY